MRAGALFEDVTVLLSRLHVFGAEFFATKLLETFSDPIRLSREAVSLKAYLKGKQCEVY